MKIPRNLIRLGATLASLVISLTLADRAHAAPIEVNNYSFESPSLPPPGSNNTWINQLPEVTGPTDPQWIGQAGSSNGNLFIELIGGFASEGKQHVGMAAGYYAFQNLGVPWEANTTYTLTVGVGYRNAGQSGTNSMTVIGLTSMEADPGPDNALQGADTADQLANDALLSAASTTVDSVAINNGGATEKVFTDVSVEYTTGDTPPAGNIVIFLGDDPGGARSHFDNVRLEKVTSLDPDGDKIPAEWETGTDRGVARNLDPAANDGGEDPDGDTLTNFQEFQLGTHPRLADTDGDGLNDNFESSTDPLNPDVDGDTLLDGAEIATYQTDPNNTDTDGDNFEDQAEIAAGTDPLDENSRPALGGAILAGANFAGGDGETPGGTVTGSTGVVSQGNWNNLLDGAGGPTILNDADGASTLLRVSWRTNGPFIAGQDPAANDQGAQLMHGILVPRGDAPGGDNVATEITVRNIAYPLYDVYIYLNSDAGGALVTVNGVDYLLEEITPYDGTFVDALANNGTGNYIHLKNLTGTQLEIVSWQANGGTGGIAGFQFEREEPADPSLLAIPERVDFGVFDGNPGPQELTIRVLNPGATKTLNVTGTTISGDGAANFSVSGVPSSLAPNQGADIKVTFNPTDTVGIYRGFLEIASNDAVTGTSRIPLIGQIKHANGLLAHYKMDETTGSVMVDSSGNGYNGTYVAGSGSVTLGAPSLAGAGTAVTFAEGGDAAYGEVPANIAFPTLASATYSFWVKQDAADVGTASVLFSRSTSPANPYAVFFEATGGPDSVIWTSEASTETLASEPFISPGEAFHVVYTYSDPNEDGSADVALYVNGVLNASASGTSGYPLNTVAPFQIGSTAGQFGLTGSFDDFQIYETVLNEEQITAMFANPGSVAPSLVPPNALDALVGYWKLDDGQGDVAAEASDAALNGTVSNGSWVPGHTGAAGDFAVAVTGEAGPGNGVGSDSYVELPALNQTFSEITIAGWVNGSATGDWTGLIQSRDGAQPIGMGIRAGSGELAYTWNNNNANTYNFVSGLAIPQNEWTFIALRVTPSEGKLYLGSNGALSTAVNAIEHLEQGNPTVWYLGKDACCGETRNFQGAFDEVTIFNKALSDDDIQALFEGTLLGGGGAGGVELLVNGSFEEPVLANINTNNLGTVPTGWSQTGDPATWNLIRNDGSAYGSGVDNAKDGNQIVDLNGIFELFQNFTLTEASDITFGASFANREGHDGSAPSTVGIYDAAGTTLLSPVVSVDTSADPTPSEVWRSGEATVTNLPAGEYQLRIALNNFNNVDAVFALASPASGGGASRDGAVAKSSGPITESTIVDFGALSGDASYEFSFKAIKGGASTAIAGNDSWGLKLDQWNEQGVFGTTQFGVADNIFDGAASVFDADVHVVFVNDSTAGETRLYVNGALTGTWAGNLDLAGESRIMGARIGAPVDLFGAGSVMYGWATYDNALSADEIAALSSTPFPSDGGGGGGAPEITGVSITAAGVSLSLPAGTTYDIEYSTDLVNWSVIASGVTGSYEDTDAARTAGGAGYYRGVVK